jgi:NADH-quinone oxidoreductase subunit M
MNAINNSILTLILLVPLAGALLVALAPDRAKLPNWIALLTTLVTFGLTLHLPFHYDMARAASSFDQDIPWIDSPQDCLPRGVDGLSLWLVVLAGLLAPIGVLASWNAIKDAAQGFLRRCFWCSRRRCSACLSRST